MSKQNDNPADHPFLGRMMLWVDKPGSANKIIWGLAIACVLLFLADFTYAKHGYFHIEETPGFYGIFGFVAFTALILIAKTLRVLIKRPEDYYDDKAVDAEDYPEDQLDKVDHDA